MGTPDFAVASLEACISQGHQILAVVTAADKLGGRGHNQWMHSAVKKYALDNDLPLLQPEKLRDASFIQQLKDLKADVFVVVAFRMLPEIVWRIPTLGTINVHGSLLPKYRGAAPINWAIIRGEIETGVTSFLISKEIDTGGILAQKAIPIDPQDDFGSLYDKMKVLGSELLVETLDLMQKGSINPMEQDDLQASSAPKLDTDTGKIDFNQSALDIHNLIRGLSPVPGAWFEHNALTYKIFESRYELLPHQYEIGSMHKSDKKTLKIYAVDGALMPTVLQAEGKRKMKVEEFLNGWNPA